MKKISLLALIIVSSFCSSFIFGELKVNYLFNTSPDDEKEVVDNTGSGFNAQLKGSASVKALGTYNLLDTGDDNGYLDMGEAVGKVIGALENFTISTYVYIDPDIVLTENGNFIWSFSNSDDIAASAIGNMFLAAKDTRYAISPTNYSKENSVKVGEPMVKGEWKHVTYVQSGAEGIIYIDGQEILSVTLTEENEKIIYPRQLGETKYNFIGKSPYRSDRILKNTLFWDFRIYDQAMSETEVASFASELTALNTLLFTEQVNNCFEQLSLGDLSEVVTDLELPHSAEDDVLITWKSSNPDFLSDEGKVLKRPAQGEQVLKVTLTATIKKQSVSVEKAFEVSVLPYFSDEESVKRDKSNIVLVGRVDNLRDSVLLPSEGIEQSTITWVSGNPEFLDNKGKVVALAPHGQGKQEVVLTATITKGSVSDTRQFTVYVAEDEGFSAYLFAYFTGNSKSDEQIFFALSDDGFKYTSLNDGKPIINSADISRTGGVRDPHILRGNDGKYYMVVTDMVSANGWSSNRGMVLLKSDNLLDWTSSAIHIPDVFENFKEVLRVWAPQVIYDEAAGKYMVYFSMLLPGGYDIIYYSYANADFTALETEPKQLYFSPTNSSAIDGDIIFHDGEYHLFFKTEGSGNGIKKAVSDKLTEGYVLYDKYLQQTTQAVEGSCVFRLYNTDNYILMYDVYNNGRYEFTQSTDLENFTRVEQSLISMNFHPRHGTVIPITAAEKEALLEKWGEKKPDKKEEYKSAQIALYPNPAQDFITLDLGDDMPCDGVISILDVNGKMLFAQKNNEAKTQIDISSLAAGLYLLQYTTEAESVTAKFSVY